MEVTLVHPDNKDQKVVATHPQQLVAFRGRGFVEEEAPKEQSTPKVQPENKDEKAKNVKVEQPNEKGSK